MEISARTDGKIIGKSQLLRLFCGLVRREKFLTIYGWIAMRECECEK